jgi:acyl carrier protein
MTEQTIDVTEAAITGWLVGQIADYLQVAPDTVVATVPLAEYGMDSVFALALCGDIEDRFGLAVEPTLAWDYPTVEQIAGFLTSELADR